ncbi:uncharacterized protein TEOVI_000056800 [Trypanosoma equiperdum]|uniref:Uncharacterized protein n=2 Tax=Trypanozoon TaxID=39700 RepID=Q38DQ4_TRYB2|nr:hypothetical protein, unlikely [Trypanosoma brucei brucei TREU927]EAN77066.1 hypothetical protein, unlikely [Trypanosoma brucei brucei TREU927]SCU68922.1 hypothetical protein, conserved [Trypanosoma equiperdum]
MLVKEWEPPKPEVQQGCGGVMMGRWTQTGQPNTAEYRLKPPPQPRDGDSNAGPGFEKVTSAEESETSTMKKKPIPDIEKQPYKTARVSVRRKIPLRSTGETVLRRG